MLSPIGNITIIKTLIISKLNHLFFSLTYPKYGIDKKINCKMFPLYGTVTQTKLTGMLYDNHTVLGVLR